MTLELKAGAPISHASTKISSAPNEFHSVPEGQRNSMKKAISIQRAFTENLENHKRLREIDCSSDSRPLKRRFQLEPISKLVVSSRKSILPKNQFYLGFDHENEGSYSGEIFNWSPCGKETFSSEEKIDEEKEVDGSLSQGSGVALSLGSSKYTGSFSNGKYHGAGYSECSNGTTDIGQFLDRKCHWEGCAELSDGTIYRGQFLNGIFCGEGFAKLPDGSKYTGSFSNGKYHGKGTFTFADGRIFKGEFSNGLFHGKGTLSLQDGRVICHGVWENDEFAEKIVKLPDNQECEGLFFKGKYNGEKVSLFSSDLKYDSRFSSQLFGGEESNLSKEDAILHDGIQENGERSDGTATLSDGSEYTGQFLNGLAHGDGVLVSEEGEFICEGIWENGELIDGIAILSDGSTYKGQLSNGKPHGNGVVILSNGLEYHGQFSNGLYHGEGTIFKEEEPLFSGKWNNNQFYGKGTITLSNGLKYTGEFSAWKFDGSGTISTLEGDVICEGEWKNGLFFDGMGLGFLPDQMIYKGQFSEGEFNGKGEIICGSEAEAPDYIIRDVRWENQKLSVHKNDAFFFSSDYWKNEGQVEDRFLFLLNEEALISLKYGEGGMPSYRPAESKLISFCPSNPALDRFENTDSSPSSPLLEFNFF